MPERKEPPKDLPAKGGIPDGVVRHTIADIPGYVHDRFADRKDQPPVKG